ncbi:MAG: branched-chain amino acid ABC transporter permease [Nitratireductor sp.]
MKLNRNNIINISLYLALLVAALAAFFLDETFIITMATKVAIFSIAGIGLNLALGYGGMVSLGHAAFFGIGGYVAGILAHHAFNADLFMQWPFEIEGTNSMLIIWPLAIVISAFFAFLIGALSIRTSGVYFIMITLAFAQMIYYFAISWPAYGGEDGLPIYVRNAFPGLNTLDPLQFFFICFAWLGVVLLICSTLIKSRFGLALQGTKQNEQRVTSVGIDTFRIKLVAFTLSGGMTGLAGALYTDLNRFVSPSVFSWQTSGEIMIFVILGGVARICGPLVGAALFITLEFTLGGLTEHWQLWLGLLLLFVVLYAPRGLMGLLEKKQVKHER